MEAQHGSPFVAAEDLVGPIAKRLSFIPPQVAITIILDHYWDIKYKRLKHDNKIKDDSIMYILLWGYMALLGYALEIGMACR